MCLHCHLTHTLTPHTLYYICSTIPIPQYSCHVLTAFATFHLFANVNFPYLWYISITCLVCIFRDNSFLKNIYINNWYSLHNTKFHFISITPPLTCPHVTSHLCLSSVHSPTNAYSEHPLRIYHPSLLPSSILPVCVGCPRWEVVRANQLLVGGGGGDGIGWLNNPAEPGELCLSTILRQR